MSHDKKFSQTTIQISVCVGSAHPSLREVLAYKRGDVIKLDRSVDDPVELRIGDRIVARGRLSGDLEGDNSQLVVRITEISDEWMDM